MGAGIHPKQAQHDDNGAEQRGVEQQLRQTVSANSGEDMGKLETDEHEDQAVYGKGEGIPHGPSLHADVGGEKLGALAAEVQAASDDGQNSGSANGFGREVSGVGREDADHDFDGAVIDAALEPFHNQTEDQADTETDGNQIGEAQSALRDGRGAALDDHGDGEFESEEAGGIVDEAFAFEDVHDPLRQAEALGDGGGGDGVGGGDDRAQDEAESPVEPRKHPARRFGDAKHGKTDQAEGEKKDADQIEFEIAPGGQPSRGIQKRREHGEEDDVGIE